MSYAKQVSNRNTAANCEIELGEEEIADVSLATFYVFDAENAAAPARGQRLVPEAAVAAAAARAAEAAAAELWRSGASALPQNFYAASLPGLTRQSMRKRGMLLPADFCGTSAWTTGSSPVVTRRGII